jgi:hypothetical protein
VIGRFTKPHRYAIKPRPLVAPVAAKLRLFSRFGRDQRSRLYGGAAVRYDGGMTALSSQPLLVLGTFNRKKGLELAEAFAPAGLRLQTLADLPRAIQVAEDGETFAANAALKAVQQARHLGEWVLGEDSGLVVDALDGAPGVFSARYSGPAANDEIGRASCRERVLTSV